MEVINRYLEDELQEALNHLRLGSKAERNINIITQYLGFDGGGGRKGGHSMQQVGEPYGLTREMVRQIVSKANKEAGEYIKNRQLPCLTKAIEIIEKQLPCSADFAEKKLEESGVVRKGFRVEGIINAIDSFGIKSTVNQIIEHREGRFIVSNQNQINWASDIVSAAIAAVSHDGAANVNELAKLITSRKETKVKTSIAVDFVKGAISSRSQNDLVWIDEESGWFYYTDVTRNRVLRRARKIFSICEIASLSNIKKGIVRSFKKDKTDVFNILPDAVLLKLLELSGDFESVGRGKCKSA